MKYKIIKTSCDCHPETCGHWKYIIIKSSENALPVCGADTFTEIKEACDKLNKETIE